MEMWTVEQVEEIEQASREQAAVLIKMINCLNNLNYRVEILERKVKEMTDSPPEEDVESLRACIESLISVDNLLGIRIGLLEDRLDALDQRG